MDKEFTPYEIALALKELGFDEPCFGHWNYNNGKINYWGDEESQNEKTNKWFLNSEEQFPKMNKNGCTAPTFSQAFRWFREKYNLLGNVYSNASGWCWEIHDNIGGTHRFESEYSGDCEESGMFTSFEKAELACLKKLIEIVKEK